jgi:CRP-like cAMP-binding protein
MSTARNHLIESLPRKDRVLFMKVCQPVTLDLARVLYERNKPTSYVYFPTEGFISLIAMTDGSPGVEVGMVGREGMLGAHLALGVLITPLHAVVQGAGTAWRLNTSEFRHQLKSSPAFQQILNRYVYVLMAQLADSAVCLRFHQIGPRLARWLLMSQDRAQSNKFHVTQEFLAYMLGVRRVGITAAAGNLQRSGLIEYSRGELTVISRSGLEAAACNCYAADRKSYIELLG